MTHIGTPRPTGTVPPDTFAVWELGPDGKPRLSDDFLISQGHMPNEPDDDPRLPAIRAAQDLRASAERVRSLAEIAEHWSERRTQLSTLALVAELLPNTDTRAALDYIIEASHHMRAAEAIRDGGDGGGWVGDYLTDADLRGLTEVQQQTAAHEDADCIARDVLVRAVKRDVLAAVAEDAA